MTDQRRRPRRLARPAGFTMIELLTVMGIIVVLMAILLPVVSRVRIQSQIAHTQAQISQIVGAIERYRADQGAYPGPVPNSHFTNNSGTGGIATDGGGVTMAENLVMGLCGGLEFTGTALKLTDPTKVGSGASTHVADGARRTRLQPYIDPTPGAMMPLQPWNPNGKTGKAGSSGDCFIPEFVDRFQDPRPILYSRANIGNGGLTAINNTTQYNYTHFVPYQTRTPVKDSQGQPIIPGDFDQATPEPENENKLPYFRSDTTLGMTTAWDNWLRNPAISSKTNPTLRGKDQFILVSAGADNIFGTRDDIFNSGNQ